MNLPLQMSAVVRARHAVSISSRRFPSGQVRPATNYCGYDSATGRPNKTCRCAANFKEYHCVGPDDPCTDCGHSDSHP